MSNPHNIKPGDWLYVVWNRRGAHNVRVAKVGRKWITLDTGDRVDLETLGIDSGGFVGPPGRCYLSPEHYEREKLRASAWSGLKFFVRDYDRPPSHLTTEAIERVLGELRGGVNER